VDVGTTFTKAVAYTSALEPLGKGRVRTPWTATATGAETHPDALVDAALEAVALALEDGGVTGTAAIGVTGMGETGVLADRRGRPLGPSIAWHDARGRDQAARLERELPRFEVRAGRRATGVCSVVKWRWLREAYPETARAVRWFAVAEWVVHRLGGHPASEASLASRTGAVDVRRGVRFDEALAWAGAHHSWLGDLVPAGIPAGRVDTGPRALVGAVATVAGLDGYASMLAAGADDPEAIFLACGTSGAAARVLDRPPADADVARAVRAGLTFDRFLDDRLAVLSAAPCGLILQPLADRDAPPEVWQQAYEAVAEGQALAVRAVEQLGPPAHELVAGGGWVDHDGLYDALERRVGPARRAGGEEVAALGAALLARAALDR
jgi:sugar (pentulose or hexulose) kinase